MKWPVVSLADALASAEVFVDGDWVESKDQDPCGDVRLVQLADVGDGEYLNKSARFLTNSKARQMRCTFLKPGDMLVARMPDPLGRACIFPGDPKFSVTAVDVCIIRPDAKEQNARWLMHCLNAPTCRSQIRGYAAGTTRARISRSNLGKIKIPLPPLVEQQRIAEILDRAETLKAKRHAALAQLDTLIQAIFIDMFGDPATNPKGWRRNALCEITSKITDGEHLNPVFSAAGMPMVMAGNVLDDLVDLRTAKTIDSTLGERFRKKCNPEKGDLLLVSRGATIGRLCSIDFTDRFCLMGSVILIKPDSGLLNNKYLSALLKHPLMWEKLYVVSGSSAQQAIYLKDIKRLSCPLPPLSLQREFARRVTVVDKLKTAHRASLAEIDALFSSLQHRAFRGEL